LVVGNKEIIMPKYCPICFAEFKDVVKDCPKDNVALLNKKSKEIERLIDIYAASDEIEAERIVAFLQDKNIDAQKSTSGISQMPAVSNIRFIISVVKESEKPAKAVITQARIDGVISFNGNFL
jgi:hypothetical protein